MSIFTSKKKRELKRQREEEIRKNKELQARISIKRTLYQMKSQLNKLDKFKKSYIEKAKNASITGNEQTYSMAKNGLKICLGKQKYLESMIVSFEIGMEMNDMNKVIACFVEGINTISEEMKTITSSVDMVNAQKAFDNAMANNLTQYEALDALMSSAANSIETMDVMGEGISDDEIDQLITNQVVDNDSEMDKEIERKMDQVREKIINK